MRTIPLFVVALLTLTLVALDAEAQRRFGGGRNLGKQRPAPMVREAPKPAPATPPATNTAAPGSTAANPAVAPARAGAAPGAVAAKPGFMGRWGGLLAGLGIGAVLASLFGEQLGPIIGMLLMGLLIAAVGFMLFRLFAGRRAPSAAAPGASPVRFNGIGSRVGPAAAQPFAGAPAQAASGRANVDPRALGEAEIDGFLRVAKTSFIRLQAANDARDLDDVRAYTTPEMYAEIAMQVGERGDTPQKTEVVSVDARLLEAVVEDDYAIASVRFTGLMRLNDAANPEPFDEIWHVRKSLRERKGAWVIAGIQQVE